jgi:hypothetical protein
VPRREAEALHEAGGVQRPFGHRRGLEFARRSSSPTVLTAKPVPRLRRVMGPPSTERSRAPWSASMSLESELDAHVAASHFMLALPPTDTLDTLLEDHRSDVVGVARGGARRSFLADSRWRLRIALALVVATTIAVYAFLTSAGRWTNWPVYWGYYDHLADAFRSGQLHSLIQPNPQLLAQADPYDHQHQWLWAWDFSLYKGKYYLYYGPVPALFEAAAKMVLGIWGVIGDQYLVFGFSCLCLVSQTLLLMRVRDRVFPRVPGYLLIAAVLAAAFANPTPHMLSSGGHYQAAIVGAQAFLLIGLVVACDAIWLAGSGRSIRLRLAFAGLAWALAIGCRISAGPAAALLIVATAIGVARPASNRFRKMATDALWLGSPVALSVFVLLLYNRVRFDEWFEFGIRYQLNTLPWRTSAGFVPLNVYSYLFREPDFSCAFPYVLQHVNRGARAFPAWLRPPADYSTQEVLVGVLVALPWAWLALPGLFLCFKQFWRKARQADSGEAAARARLVLWCVASFAILAVAMIPPTIVGFCATMRYLGDATSGILLLAALGAFSLYDSASDRPVLRRSLGVGLCLAAAATIVFGLLLGFQGYENHFKKHNPELASKFERALSLCSKAARH